MKNLFLIISMLVFLSCSKSDKKHDIETREDVVHENGNEEDKLSTTKIIDNASQASSDTTKTYTLNSDTTKKYIKEFYEEYVNNIFNREKIEALKNQYCSRELLDSLDTVQLYADPFLKAQDFDLEWFNSFKIQKDENDDNLFIVTYDTSYDDPPTNFDPAIYLWVKEDTDKLVITNIR